MAVISQNKNELQNKQRAFLPDPAGFFGLATFWSLFLLSGKKSLLCADTLWHIKVGQIILDNRQILTKDIFSHTVANKPWTAHEWLSEVFMALCYNAGGFPGVSLVFFTFASFTIYLLFKISQKVSSEWAAFLSITIAAAFAQTHLLIRPHIFTWLFGALFIAILMNQSRWIWILPLLTALWGNLHGGVLIGLVLQGAFLTGQLLDSLADTPLQNWKIHWNKIRPLFWVFLISCIALGFNPFGYSLLLFPFKVSAEVFSQNISEWKAPDFQQVWHARIWLILLGILLATYARKTTWAWRLLILFLVYQALGHTRHLSIAALFLAPWTAMALHNILKKIKSKASRKDEIALSTTSGPILITISFLTLFTISTFQPNWWIKFSENRFSLSEGYSQKALVYLQENGFPGDYLLNEYSWGGFLIFSLDPPPKVFIDGRADMYGEEVFSDYVKLHYVHPDTEKLLTKYNVDWILYAKNSLLVRYMRTKPDWQQVFVDDHVAILALKKPAEPPSN